MSRPIEFYFDFASPYGFIASTAIDAIATKAPCIYGGYHFAQPATQRLPTDCSR